MSGANALIDKAAGVVTAPNAKAKASALKKFNRDVDADIGSPLTSAQAAILKQLAANL